MTISYEPAYVGEVAVYRVVAVTNVARHAGVADATVDLALLPGFLLRVVVRDAGRSAGGWVDGMGLTSMRERVEQIGGTLNLSGGPGGGVITAHLPLTFRATDRAAGRVLSTGVDSTRAGAGVSAGGLS